jgi:NitT/TauT family transport system ATP-binding protein
MIQFERVGKKYNNLVVIQNLSFSINKNDVIGILGPSGVGKSTILKLIAGLITPDSGTISSNGKRIAYVFQEPRLLPWKTALDNVAISLLPLGYNYKQAREKAAEQLGKMGLRGYEGHFPAQLSGGMIQRVSLARAFAIEPDTLLLDEPFSALDIGLKKVLLDMIKEQLKARPVTVLYVSHMPEEVVQIANRIFMLFSKGTMEELPVNTDELFKSLRRNQNGLCT